MKKQFTLTLFTFIILVSTFGQSFKEHHTITSGSLPSNVGSIEVIDLNNDGEKDILACSSLGRYIYLLENKGNMEFKVLQELEYDLYELNDVSSSDINNDGLMDLIYSRYDYSGQLAWKKNIGNNEFSVGGTLYDVPSSGWRSVSFTVVDLNGDDIDDIIISSTNNDHNDLLYRINRGNGIFNPIVSLLDTGEVVKYNCIDIDNDGDNDIVYSTKNPNKLVAAINNGFGEFSEEIIFGTNVIDPLYKFHCFDTDGDSDIDVMGFTENDSISLFVNIGSAVFEQVITNNDSLFTPYEMTSLDIDNDGDLDLFSSYAEVLENVGNNSFIFKKDSVFKYYIGTYKIFDINNNGDEDLIYKSGNGSIAYIEDVSFDNFKNWRILTSQLFRPMYPSYNKINNDEFPDICIMDYQYKYVFYLNNGFGEFYDTVAMDRLHIYSHESAFYDINKDGYCDIVSYSDYESNDNNDSSNFKLARNNGDNTFAKFYINDFEALNNKYANYCDYNDDDILNAVLTAPYYNSKTDTILFFNINQDFTVSLFDTIIFEIPIEIRNYKFYDIDMDGQKDLIVNDEHTLLVNYSNNGRFDNYFDTIINSTNNIYDFVFANISNDTLIDLLFSEGSTIVVMENFDGTHFAQKYSIEINSFALKVFAEDLNKDNSDEVFYLGNDTIGVLKIEGNNNYTIEKYYYNNNTYNYGDDTPLVFTDIDMDGDVDLLCTYSRESDLSWFENSFIDTIDYTLFPENNAVWTEQNAIYEGNPPQTWTSLYVTESDTILLGNSYTNIYEYYLNPATFDTIRQLYASIRQDKLEKRVYIIRHYLIESNEKLLLDFKANIGDTIMLDAYYWDLDPLGTDSIFIVDSINTTTIYNLEEREIHYLSNHKEQTPVSLTIIEGIGSIQNPFGPVNNLVNKKQYERTELCCPDYLLCLSIDDELVYVLNDESSCNSLEVWSSIESQSKNQIFSIYPNPAKDNLNITFQERLSSEFEILIYDIHGKLVNQLYGNKNENKFTIGLNDYKPGIYLLRIKYNDILYSSRFIILE